MLYDIKQLLSNLEVLAIIPSMQTIQYLFGILSLLFNSEMYYPKPADIYGKEINIQDYKIIAGTCSRDFDFGPGGRFEWLFLGLECLWKYL